MVRENLNQVLLLVGVEEAQQVQRVRVHPGAGRKTLRIFRLTLNQVSQDTNMRLSPTSLGFEDDINAEVLEWLVLEKHNLPAQLLQFLVYFAVDFPLPLPIWGTETLQKLQQLL